VPQTGRNYNRTTSEAVSRLCPFISRVYGIGQQITLADGFQSPPISVVSRTTDPRDSGEIMDKMLVGNCTQCRLEIRVVKHGIKEAMHLDTADDILASVAIFCHCISE
jgi:hypothetical protein